MGEICTLTFKGVKSKFQGFWAIKFKNFWLLLFINQKSVESHEIYF